MMKGKGKKHFSGFDVLDKRISVKQIIAELKGKSQDQMTLVKAYKCHIANIEKLVGFEPVYDSAWFINIEKGKVIREQYMASY